MKKIAFYLSAKVTPEQRKEYTDFAKELKAKLKKHIPGRYSVTVSKSSRPNPYIQAIAIGDTEMPNKLRVLVAKGINAPGVLNWDDVSYGNIQKKWITIHYSEWKNLINKL